MEQPEIYELVIGDFIMRFKRNEDGTYGRPYTFDELNELQFIAGLSKDDACFAMAIGPCGK